MIYRKIIAKIVIVYIQFEYKYNKISNNFTIIYTHLRYN